LGACAFAVVQSCKLERVDIDCPSNAALAHPLEQRHPARQEFM
jgi:predicted outer membrane lipoprotein